MARVHFTFAYGNRFLKFHFFNSHETAAGAFQHRFEKKILYWAMRQKYAGTSPDPFPASIKKVINTLEN